MVLSRHIFPQIRIRTKVVVIHLFNIFYYFPCRFTNEKNYETTLAQMGLLFLLTTFKINTLYLYYLIFVHSLDMWIVVMSYIVIHKKLQRILSVR